MRGSTSAGAAAPAPGLAPAADIVTQATAIEAKRIARDIGIAPIVAMRPRTSDGYTRRMSAPEQRRPSQDPPPPGDPRWNEVVDRRSGLDRRDTAPASPTNLERRRGPGRRLTDFVKSAEEGEMNREQYLFLMAIDAFKRVNRKTFPSWTDVLEIIRKLGYRKTMPSELNLGERANDWTERPDADSGVNKPAERREE
jgi:hypothetical protein